MTDIETLVQDAQAKGTFDVLAAAKGRAYPEDDVVIYTDSVAAYEFQKTEAQIAVTEDAETVNALDAHKAELRAAIKASALTFHLRGIEPGHIQALMAQAKAKFPASEDEAFNQERADWFEGSILSDHIVNVTNAEGAVDDHRWTPEQVADLKAALPTESFEKLMEGVNGLSFASAFFDQAVSSDFS